MTQLTIPTEAAAAAMNDPKQYRLKLPDEPDTADSTAPTNDLALFYERVLSLGRKRSQKVDEFASIMREWPVADVYFTLRIWTDNRLVHPMHTLDIGKSIVRRAVAKTYYNGNRDRVDELCDDAGSVSRLLRDDTLAPSSSFGTETPTVGELFESFRELKDIGGESSMVDHISETIEPMQHPWIFTYWLNKDLTFYVGQYMMRKAMVDVYHNISSSQAKAAQRINNDVPSLFLYYHQDGVLRTELQAHDRMGNMKAKSFDTEDIAEIDHSQWVAQTKYDGARIFIHHDGDGDIRAYTTGKRDITAAMPELFDVDWPSCPFIFDGEATPYDADTGEVRSFQQILRRIGRKPDEVLDAAETDGLEIKFKLFDCPLWHGDDIRNRPFEDRFNIIRTVFPPPMVAQQGTDIEATFHRSIEAGHEGVVLKQRGHEYVPDGRKSSWRKWKADPMEVDVVINGATRGGGRINDRLGALSIALEHDGRLIDVGSVGTGFSDKDRLELWRRHQAGTLEGKVCQVSFEELQHGRDDSDLDTSWALRFPSFDYLRPDGEVDSLEHAASLDGKDDAFDEWQFQQSP